jgi:hypothetical protein
VHSCQTASLQPRDLTYGPGQIVQALSEPVTTTMFPADANDDLYGVPGSRAVNGQPASKCTSRCCTCWCNVSAMRKDADSRPGARRQSFSYSASLWWCLSQPESASRDSLKKHVRGWRVLVSCFSYSNHLSELRNEQ